MTQSGEKDRDEAVAWARRQLAWEHVMELLEHDWPEQPEKSDPALADALERAPAPKRGLWAWRALRAILCG